jgi:hypothetical protein
MVARTSGDVGAECDLRLLTVSETAAILRKSERTLRRWRARGRIAAVDLDGVVYFEAAEVRRLVRDGLMRSMSRAYAGNKTSTEAPDNSQEPGRLGTSNALVLTTSK